MRRRFEAAAGRQPGVLRWIRRAVLTVVGFSVLLFGLALVFTPLPGILVFPVGLGILATQFVWARRALRWVRRKMDELTGGAPHA